METDRKVMIHKLFLSLLNLWPAGLVALLVVLSLPGTLPALKELPERLIPSETEAAVPKPALPDPETELPPGQEGPLADSGNTYPDGVYKGSSRGYGGDITVQVTVKDGKIAEIIVLSAPGETGSFLSKAKGVIDRVIQAQTWEVDVVSGATYSSRGILGAVRNALTGEKVENKKPPKQPSPKAPLKQQPFDDNVIWKDGVYTGSAMGFGGTIKVQVTIKGGKIADIQILEHKGESSSYFKKAKKVVSRILNAGTPNVDTVSGATYSSNGIINAVKNALKKAAGGTADDPAETDPGNTPGREGDTIPGKEETEEPDITNGFNDGTYSVDVDCTDGRIFDYTIRVIMQVKGGAITTITAKITEDRSDNPEMNLTYFSYAVDGRAENKETESENTGNGKAGNEKIYRSVIEQILEAQSTKDVDAVSGATYSSKAILRGVRQLFAKAAKNKEDVENPGDEDDEQEEKPGKKPEKEPENDPVDEGEDPDGKSDDTPEAEDGLEDGTYKLEAVCTDDPDDPLFDYTILVTMRVKNGGITSITAKITEDRSNDPETNKTYFSYAVNGRTKKDVTYRSVIEQILEAQSTKDIDTVSGATYSSKTILNTVKKLLRQAAKTKTDDPEDSGEEEDPSDGEGDEKDPSGDGKDPSGDEGDEKDPSEDEIDPSEDEKDPSGEEDPDDHGEDPAQLRDGTYTSEVDCTDDPDEPTFDYTLKMTVVIEDGKIVSVGAERTVDRSEEPDDNARYISFAKEGRKWKGKEYEGVISQILSAQGTSGVDTVSGATYSSKAILKGVRNALEKAAESGGEGEEQDQNDPENQDPENQDPENPGGNSGENQDPENQDPENPGGDSEENQNPENQDPENPGGDSGENQDPENQDPENQNPGGDSGENQDPENPGGDEGGEEETPLFLDGIYTATALCTDDPEEPFFSYTVKVTVVVEDGVIRVVSAEKTDDESEEPEENESYMKIATEGKTRKGRFYPGIPAQAVEQQGASDLDAVSGATYSSRAMIDALGKAIEQAKNPDA